MHEYRVDRNGNILRRVELDAMTTKLRKCGQERLLMDMTLTWSRLAHGWGVQDRRAETLKQGALQNFGLGGQAEDLMFVFYSRTTPPTIAIMADMGGP
jgi:hypothetical protein